MEQVTLTSQPGGLYILNGQAVFIQNGVDNRRTLESTNGDVVQQAVNGLTATVATPTRSEIGLSDDGNSVAQNYVLLNNEKVDDGRVVQLSISDDFPLHFLDQTQQKEMDEETSDCALLKNIFASDNDKSDGLSSPDILNSFLKLSPQGNLGNQFELVSPLNGKFTYAFQLSNGTKLYPVSTVEGEVNNINVYADVHADSSKPNGVVSDGSYKATITNSQPLQNGRKLVYANKILNGGNLKPRIILNTKSKYTQDAKKRISPKIPVLPSKGKSLLINNPRTSTPQKVATPGFHALKDKKVVNVSKLLVHKDLKTKNFGLTVPLNTLLKSKTAEPILADGINATLSDSSIVHNDATSQQSLFNLQSLQQSNTEAVTVPSLLKQEQPDNETKPVGSESSIVHTDSTSQQSFNLQSLQQSDIDAVTVPSLLKKEQSDNETKPVGRLTESQLKKIAAVFRNSCLNRTRLTNATIFDTETNTRIICRVVYPEDLIKDDQKQVVKRGKKRARSVGTKKSVLEEEKTEKPPSPLPPPPPSARTRSGRLSRPPRYMVKDFKKLTEDSEVSYSDFRSDFDESIENAPFLPLPDPQHRKLTTKFHCPTCGKLYLGKRRMLKHFTEHPDHRGEEKVFEWEDEYLGNAKQEENEKNLWWKKIFKKGIRKPKMDDVSLLKELFHPCPNELFIPLAKERIAEHVDPWDYLKTRQLKEGGGVMTLLSDLSSLIKMIPKNLLIPAHPEDSGSVNIEDEKLCHLLNISPGYYLPNESALNADKVKETPDENITTPEIDTNCEQPADNSCPIKSDMCDDNTMKMDIEPAKMETVDDISKEDSSELSELLLEKSSLESFDQIVNERLNDLIPTSPLDVSSMVEAQVLARSLLTSSPDLLHGVSGSTEDLMKTLENLTPDLPTDSTSSDFDFAVLSSDFTSDR